jgi:hypothetical protein
MRTRQSLPVNGCDGDGSVGISIWQGILSRGCRRLQFKFVNEMRQHWTEKFLEARLLIAVELILVLYCPPLPEWHAAHETYISTNHWLLGSLLGMDSRWHGFVSVYRAEGQI